MYILTSDQKSIVDTSFVERFCLVEKPDACLIIASYSSDRAVTIGKYEDKEEAHGVLSAIYTSLSFGDTSYSMPDSRLFGSQKWIRDARQRRKGGS